MSTTANADIVEQKPSADDLRKVCSFIARHFPSRKISRILLVNPPDSESRLFRYATAKRRRYPNYPPYGLGILAQELRHVGVEPRIINLNNSVLASCHASSSPEEFDFDKAWQDDLSRAIREFNPDLIGVTCMFTMTHVSLKGVCEYASTYSIPIAIGGVHVNNDVDRVLDDIPSARIAFLRESDVALKRFCEVVAGTLDAADLCQLILNDSGWRYRFAAECQPTSSEIDVIPAYDLMDISQLSRAGVMGNFYGFKSPDTRFATALSNRGCRAQCTFCSVRNFNGVGVRQRSVDSVIEELSILKNEYGIGHIVWLDDDLLKDHKRSLELFDGIVQRNLGITWDATNGVIAASCKEEIVHAMADSGCIALNIGVESGNPQILRQIKKPGTIKTFVAAAEVLRRYPQIHTRAFLMVGFPGETLAMVNDTINLAREMDLDWSGITVLQPLPNTPIYDSMVEQGLIQNADRAETRFNAGGYGKQDEIDLGLRMASKNFEEAFCSIPLDSVPTGTQLTDIWFYMNYHLNFHRLFTEEREIKIKQQFSHLANLCDLISPEHGLALYFIGYLQHKLYGHIDPNVIDRLDKKLKESEYWSSRLSAFGLSVNDLVHQDFKNKNIPRLMPGRLPYEFHYATHVEQ